MSAEKVIYALLQGLVAGRVYPIERPQQTSATGAAAALPALTYVTVSEQQISRLAKVPGPNRYRARMQIDGFAVGYAASKTLQDNVRNALHLQSGTVAGVVVQVITVDSVRDMGRDPGTDLHQVQLDAIVEYWRT